LFARNRAVTDVSAVLCAFPVNLLHNFISVLLRSYYCATERGYAQHASAAGDDLAIAECGAGMKYLHIGCIGERQTLDDVTFLVATGISESWLELDEERVRGLVSRIRDYAVLEQSRGASLTR